MFKNFLLFLLICFILTQTAYYRDYKTGDCKGDFREDRYNTMCNPSEFGYVGYSCNQTHARVLWCGRDDVLCKVCTGDIFRIGVCTQTGFSTSKFFYRCA
jgi:hypothetical protein